MTKDKERDDALIAEAAEMFPPDTVDVQSRYVIVHQLRASADIQDAQTKRETGWADTSDRACLMRKAADTLDALLHKLQPAPKPDRYMMTSYEVWKTYKNEGPGAAADVLRKHFSEAERPAVEVPLEIAEALARLVAVIKMAGVCNLSRGVQLGQISWSVKCSEAIEWAEKALSHLDGAKGDE